MTLPEDPNMLLSFLNLKLRDSYSSLEDLCDDLDIDYTEALEKIDKAGLLYMESTNQYKCR